MLAVAERDVHVDVAGAHHSSSGVVWGGGVGGARGQDPAGKSPGKEELEAVCDMCFLPALLLKNWGVGWG